VPAFIDRRGGNGWVFAAAAVAMFSVAGVLYGRAQAKWIGDKTQRIGVGGDQFRADNRAALVKAVVARIVRQLPTGKTLAVLPEGCMINYLSKRHNSTPYIHLMPVEAMLFGEEPILAAFRAHPPDMIVLVNKDTTEFGFPFFGHDYAKPLGGWIATHYRQVLLLGQPPFQSDQFGIALLENQDASAARQSPRIEPRRAAQ
jgi:hypothetical protein